MSTKAAALRTGSAIAFAVCWSEPMRPRTLDHQLNAIEPRLTHVEERLTILETIHRHHMADIDKRLAKLKNRRERNLSPRPALELPAALPAAQVPPYTSIEY